MLHGLLLHTGHSQSHHVDKRYDYREGTNPRMWPHPMGNTSMNEVNDIIAVQSTKRNLYSHMEIDRWTNENTRPGTRRNVSVLTETEWISTYTHAHTHTERGRKISKLDYFPGKRKHLGKRIRNVIQSWKSCTHFWIYLECSGCSHGAKRPKSTSQLKQCFIIWWEKIIQIIMFVKNVKVAQFCPVFIVSVSKLAPELNEETQHVGQNKRNVLKSFRLY